MSVTPQGQPLEDPQAYSLPDRNPKCMYKRKDMRFIVNLVVKIFSSTAKRKTSSLFHTCRDNYLRLLNRLMQGILF